MTRNFSLSSHNLGIKGVNDFIAINIEFLFNLIQTDYGPIKERTLYVCYDCKANENLQEEEKEKLPYCLPAGIFNYRNLKGLADYSCYACFDIDANPDIQEEAEYLSKVWEQLKGCPLVRMQWHSVRGGIKFIVEHDNTDPLQHKELLVAIVGELEKRGVDMAKVDSKCYNVTRAQFVSYDPEVIMNDNSEVFHYEPAIATKQFTAKPHKQKQLAIEKLLPKPKSYVDDWSAIQAVQKESDERFPIVKGYRNQNTFIFASKLKDLGVSEEMATKYLILRYSEEDFPASEIVTIINNIYERSI